MVASSTANARLNSPRKARLLATAALFSLLTLPPLQTGAQEYVEPPTISAPAEPLVNTVTEAETVLPAAKTPNYFERLYRGYMRAPLPSRIYAQGGIPRLVPKLQIALDPFGTIGSYVPSGPIVTATHPFFDTKLGTNGRSCATCHQPPSAMSISLRNIKQRFQRSRGNDPLFAPVDGANCPTAVPAANTAGSLYGGLRGRGMGDRARAHGLLLNKGLIRIPLPWPPADNPNPEFTLKVVKDAFGNCNSDPEFGLPKGFVNVYRRPQISAVLNHKTIRKNGTLEGAFGGKNILPGSLMWDGREPSVTSQARSAIFGHAQRAQDQAYPATQAEFDAKLAQIEQFQSDFFTGQYSLRGAGLTSANGATGGPIELSKKDVNLLTAAPGTPIFDEYTAWLDGPGVRASVERGQKLFHTRPFQLSEVVGSNLTAILIRPGPTTAEVPLPNPPFPGGQLPASLTGTCSVCHATEHAGSDNLRNPFRDLATNGSRKGKVVVGAASALNPAPDLPLFELTCTTPNDEDHHPFLPTTVQVTDPGRALITGKCRDIGGFVVPSLRGLAAREPYFHNGTAKNIRAVVDFYSARFRYLAPDQTTEQPLSEQEKVDLTNFLAAL